MPSTVASLLDSVGLEPGGSVPWGTAVPETATGVYVVSLTSDATRVDGTHDRAPISHAALDELAAACPALTLDGQPRPSSEHIADRIGDYWLPDECVLYIGLAGQPLRTRVRQYYKTPLGAAKPHAGGWWLKTLAVLDEVHVHFAATDDFKDAEEEMLRAFAMNVSAKSRGGLPAGEPVMPFANLRDGDWRRRSHGIGGATDATAARENAPATTASARPQPTRTQPSAASTSEPSQRVTEKDIATGQVRIPRGTKGIFPSQRQDIEVLLRGRRLTCRWDPRLGPPERSGVIRVGKEAARDLLRTSEVLAVSVRDDGSIELA